MRKTVILTILINIITIYANAGKPTKMKFADIDKQHINFRTDSIPGWKLEVINGNHKKKEYWGSRGFTFFNDSLVIPVIGTKNPGKMATAYGRYYYLNDSIIELDFRNIDNLKNPVIVLSYDSTSSEFINISIKNNKKYVNDIAKSLRLYFAKGDSLVSKKEPFSEDYVKWLTGIYNEAESKIKIPNDYPDKLILSFDYLGFHLEYLKTPYRTVTIDYTINIEDYTKNYLEVIDNRDSRENKVNNISILFSSWNNTWYPKIIRFKRKDNKLILLNKDLSETEITLNIKKN